METSFSQIGMKDAKPNEGFLEKKNEKKLIR